MPCGTRSAVSTRPATTSWRSHCGLYEVSVFSPGAKLKLAIRVHPRGRTGVQASPHRSDAYKFSEIHEKWRELSWPLSASHRCEIEQGESNEQVRQAGGRVSRDSGDRGGLRRRGPRKHVRRDLQPT